MVGHTFLIYAIKYSECWEGAPFISKNTLMRILVTNSGKVIECLLYVQHCKGYTDESLVNQGAHDMVGEISI